MNYTRADGGEPWTFHPDGTGALVNVIREADDAFFVELNAAIQGVLDRPMA